MTSNDVADIFNSLMEGIHTLIPATVVSVSGAFVTARPSLGIMMDNGQKIEIPDLEDVPLLMLGTGKFSIELAMSPGDPLMLMVLESDARKWMTQEWGEQVEAASPLRFGIGGCVAIPVCRANGNKENKITVDANGKIAIVNSAGVSVVMDSSGKLGMSNASGSVKTLIDDLWAELNSLATDLNTWATPFGATPASLAAPVLGAGIFPIAAVMTARIASITTKAQKVGLLLQ